MTALPRLALTGLAIAMLASTTVGCETFSGAGQPVPSSSPTASGTLTGGAPASQVPSSSTGQPPASPPPPSPITTLRPATSMLPGPFVASTADGQQFVVTLATKGNPRPYRRPVAFYRLAQTLGYDQVAATELRRLETGRVSQLLQPFPEARQYLAGRATVTNDGTIAALLVRQVPGVEALLADHDRIARWAKLAASPDPLPAADASYVGDYVRLLVLDYLAGNVQRHSLVIDEHGGRLVATDNRTAFPGYVSPEALNIPLGRLEPVVRFPADLKTALLGLDRATVARQLVRGRFEDRLLGPRQLTDLAERRATLLTLLESRLQQYGPTIVFSL